MPKRRIPITELDFEERDESYELDQSSPVKRRKPTQAEEEDYESPETQVTDSNIPIDDEIQHYVNKLIRFCLAKETKGQLIRREQIRDAISIQNKKIQTDLLLTLCKKQLNEIYGLDLIETANIEKKDKSKKKASSTTAMSTSKRPFALVNTLKPRCKDVLGELWSKNSSKVKKEYTSNQIFIPKYEKTPLPTSNIELVKSGIMILIISLIILNENHLNEVHLIKYLKKFGISESINMKNSNTNMNLQDMLKELEAKNYLNKEVIKGAVESENMIDYSLGRRSLVEFGPEDCFSYIKFIYGDDFNSTIGERILVTIQKCYKVLLELDSATNPTTNENSATTTPTPVA